MRTINVIDISNIYTNNGVWFDRKTNRTTITLDECEHIRTLEETSDKDYLSYFYCANDECFYYKEPLYVTLIDGSSI